MRDHSQGIADTISRPGVTSCKLHHGAIAYTNDVSTGSMYPTMRLSFLTCFIPIALAPQICVAGERVDYSEQELEALRDALVQRGFHCEEVTEAVPVGWTLDYVTVRVTCRDDAYRMSIWPSGSVSVETVR